LAGWLTALVAVLVALDAVGAALPTLPNSGQPARLVSWVDQVGAVPAAFALLRVLALVVTGYLLATTVLGTTARLARSASLTRLVDVATLPQLRRFLHHAVGAGTLAVAVPLGAGLSPAAIALAPPAALAQPAPIVLPPDASPPTIRGIAAVDPTTTVSPTAPEMPATADPAPPPTDPPVARAHPDATTASEAQAAQMAESVPQSNDAPHVPPTAAGADPETTPTANTEKGAPSPAPTAPTASAGAEPPFDPATPGTGQAEPASTEAAPPDGSWRIEAGDHLWRVAASTLERRWNRPPTEPETAAYLDRIIETNRASLVVPDNPDLVFAGQVFVLPEVPAA
jgi:hypothetical protein